MSSMKLTFNSDGFKQILTGDGVKDLITEKTQEIANKANSNLTISSEGFEARVWEGSMMSKYGYGGRWMGSVVALDNAASRDEAETKCLSKAVN